MRRLTILLVLLLCFPAQAGIVQDLIDEGEGVLVLYHDYRAGHMVDLSGQGNDGTGTSALWSGGGVNVIPSGKIKVTDAAEIRLTTGTLFVIAEFGNQMPAQQRLIQKSDSIDFLWYLDATNVRFNDSTQDRFLAVDVAGSAGCLALNFVSDDTGEVFVDGVSAGNLNGASGTIGTSSDDLWIGNRDSGAAPTQGAIQVALMTNRVLTDTEHSQLCSELLGMRWPRAPYSRSTGVYGPEILVDGDMEESGVADWTAYAGATLSKESNRLYMGQQSIRAVNDIGYGGARQTILTVGTTYRVFGGTRGNGTSVPSVWVGGSAAHWTGTSSTAWQLFDIVGTADSYTYFTLYNTGASTNWVEFDDVSVREVLQPEVQFQTSWGVTTSITNLTAAGYLENTPLEWSSGTAAITTDTINGVLAKTLTCVADCSVFMLTETVRGDSTQDAYGTWTIWMNKADDADALVFDLTSTGSTGYRLTLDSSEKITFQRVFGSVLMSTVADYVQLDTWYELTVTRDYADEWTVYLDGVPIEADSGTNPATDGNSTTSLYMVWDMGAGDQTGWSAVDGSYALVKSRGVNAP